MEHQDIKTEAIAPEFFFLQIGADIISDVAELGALDHRAGAATDRPHLTDVRPAHISNERLVMILKGFHRPIGSVPSGRDHH